MTRTYSLLAPHIVRELTAARAARRQNDPATVWSHLERAHVLSQPSALHHTHVHWLMLLTALRFTDPRELLGQVLRIAVAGVGSLLGRYPLGNTGRARVHISRPMPISPDLQTILDDVERARTNVGRSNGSAVAAASLPPPSRGR